MNESESTLQTVIYGFRSFLMIPMFLLIWLTYLLDGLDGLNEEEAPISLGRMGREFGLANLAISVAMWTGIVCLFIAGGKLVGL